jgi:hypothetical protein
MLKIEITFHYEKNGCFATRLAIHCISKLMSAIEQVARVVKDVTYRIYDHTLVQLIAT